jgi:hypothetical protein
VTRLWIEVEAARRTAAADLSLEGGVLGSAPEVELVADHPSIAPRHARLVVRRGQVLLVPLEGRVSWIATDAALHAPVVLVPERRVRVGELALGARLAEGPALGTWAFGWRLERAWPLDDEGRRYRSAPRGHEHAELVVRPGPSGAPRAALRVEPTGLPLARLRAAGLSAARLAQLAARAGARLAALHERGEVHGAFEDEVVRIDRDGQVHVAFGPASGRPATAREAATERARVEAWLASYEAGGHPEEGAGLAAALAPMFDGDRTLLRLGAREAACRVAPS